MVNNSLTNTTSCDDYRELADDMFQFIPRSTSLSEGRPRNRLLGQRAAQLAASLSRQ